MVIGDDFKRHRVPIGLVHESRDRKLEQLTMLEVTRDDI